MVEYKKALHYHGLSSQEGPLVAGEQGFIAMVYVKEGPRVERDN